MILGLQIHFPDVLDHRGVTIFLLTGGQGRTTPKPVLHAVEKSAIPVGKRIRIPEISKERSSSVTEQTLSIS